MKSERLNNIDWLRLFLALEVVAGHLWNVPFIIPPVPAFLALSGACILQSRINSRSVWHFWWKRVLRILPAFLMMLSLSAILFGWPYIRETLANYATFGWHAPIGHSNYVVWTLSCEEAAYLLLVALFAFGLVRRTWVAPAFLASSFGVLLWSNWDWHALNIVLLSTSFFLGIAFAQNSERLDRWMPAVRVLSPIFFVAFLASQSLSPQWQYGMQIPAVFGCLALAYGTQLKVRLRWDLSYGVYIYHAAISFALWSIVGNTQVHHALTVAVALMVAAASWRFMEKPALKLKDWQPQTKKTSCPRRDRTQPAIEAA